MWEQQEIERLARLVAASVKGVRPARPGLKLVPDTQDTQAHIQHDTDTRSAYLQRIRFLAEAYGLQWLVDQETFDRGSLRSLDAIKLAMLLETMERARECLLDGISLDDAGIARSLLTPLQTRLGGEHA